MHEAHETHLWAGGSLDQRNPTRRETLWVQCRAAAHEAHETHLWAAAWTQIH